MALRGSLTIITVAGIAIVLYAADFSEQHPNDIEGVSTNDRHELYARNQ